MTEFVDTHAHLNDERFADDLAAAVERAAAAQVTRIINMGDTIESSMRVAELAAAYAPLYAAVGVHPEECVELTEGELTKLAMLTEQPKIVAVGEIGLDYYWEKDGERRLLQQKLFRQQLDLARQVRLPVCIHDREAHGDTLAILKTEGKGLTGVLHCFSGSYETALEIFRLGFFIGVDGPLTFKNAAKLPEIVAKCPRDRLLLETDSPYMSPVPRRGKRNEPSYIPYIAAKVAEIWGVTPGEVTHITTRNAENLYGKLSLGQSPMV